jgi:hypothetical protein
MALIPKLARPSPRAFHVRPQVEMLESRLVPYSVSGNVWPDLQLVTISFVPDGTTLGSGANGHIYRNLFATFNNHAGWITATWERQILKAAQVWAPQTDLDVVVVADEGTPLDSGNYQQGNPNMGDIRSGGYGFVTITLATPEASPNAEEQTNPLAPRTNSKPPLLDSADAADPVADMDFQATPGQWLEARIACLTEKRMLPEPELELSNAAFTETDEGATALPALALAALALSPSGFLNVPRPEAFERNKLEVPVAVEAWLIPL